MQGLTRNQAAPGPRYVFRPLLYLKPDKVRVVIVGREPSGHRPYEEHDGFAYSSNRFTPNGRDGLGALQVALFDELENDLKGHHKIWTEPKGGSLLKWVRQGVLLWNWYPTVTSGIPGSHSDWGWGRLSKEILETLYLNNPDVIFVPWGVPNSREFTYRDILPTDALTIDSPGPSFLNQHVGFFHSSPFSKINHYIDQFQLGKPIDWNLT